MPLDDKEMDAVASPLVDRSGDVPMAEERGECGHEEAEDNERGNPQAKKRKQDHSTADETDEETDLTLPVHVLTFESAVAGVEDPEKNQEELVGTTSGAAAADLGHVTPIAEPALDETEGRAAGEDAKCIEASVSAEGNTGAATAEAEFAHHAAAHPPFLTNHRGSSTGITTTR